MSEILFPALAMGSVGLVLGLLLAVASKVFAVKVDEKAVAICEVLPGANCGSCGYAGCSAYAAAISSGKAKPNCCSPGGQAVADKIAEIMGVTAEGVEEKCAVVCCDGKDEFAAEKYEYIGEADCVCASKLQGGGAKDCSYGCLGLGTCAKVCSHGAISIVDGIAHIDYEKCGGCGECAAACPKNIIKIVSTKQKYAVKCASCDKGAAMKEKCSVGCIGCRICEKNCPAGAIKIENNLAVIDYEKCTNCGLCAEKCPRKIIRETTDERQG